MFKRALVSVSDKTGLVEFLKPIVDQGCEVVSTGGTSLFLKQNHIEVTEVAQVTGFPEVMDGRVRTLHPHIHMALLARSFVPEDLKLLMEHKIKPFDLVIVNLYPFEQAYYSKKLTGHDLIEQIDIGGPTLLRASAKSSERITVVCDPQDYKEVLSRCLENRIDEDYRLHLALKVFNHCAFYDSMVATALTEQLGETPLDLNYFTRPYRKKQTLRYGENPHQKSVLYQAPGDIPLSLNRAEFLQGKELSYNNILDLESAISVVSDFSGPCVSIIKHNNPCGVAIGHTIQNAYESALSCDPVSSFGGIVALTRPVDGRLAQVMTQTFLECVVAPDFDSEALDAFSKKKNLRVLKLPELSDPKVGTHELDVKSLRGGMIVQDQDRKEEWNAAWKTVGREIPEDIKKTMIVAQNVVRHVKSNAIVIAQGNQTVGLCGGQTNRVDSVKMALERAHLRGFTENLVMGSDAFFPFRDSIDLAAKYGVRWIIQPGGSMRDAEVEQACLDLGLGMVLTGVRHFKH